MPSKYSHELVFDPSSGLMRQNEHLYINCSFAPYAKKNYKIKPIFKAREVLDLSQSMVGYFLPGNKINSRIYLVIIIITFYSRFRVK